MKHKHSPEDETYLEYHSPEEGNTSGEDSDDDGPLHF